MTTALSSGPPPTMQLLLSGIEEYCSGNDNSRRRNRHRRQNFSLVVVVLAITAIIAASLVPGHNILVNGLTPSKSRHHRSKRAASTTTATATTTTRTSNLSAASAAASIASNPSVGGLWNQNNENQANAKKRNTHHRRKQQGHNRNQYQYQYQQQSSQTSQVSIFVKNLHYQAEKADIVKACKKAYGDVKSVWIPQNNAKKGYAKVEFQSASAAQKALSNGRLNVLGRHAYLVSDTRKADPRGDAFRFLAAFSKGDFEKRNLPKSKILREAGNAGTPRNEKETGILAASLARIGARDELLEILSANGNVNRNHHHQHRSKGPSTSVFNAALSGLKVSSLHECDLAKEIVNLAERGPGVNARTYATAIASIKRGVAASALAPNANERSQLSNTASVFLKTARDRGLANHVVYNELISCLGKTGAWKMATSVLDTMFEDDRVEPTEVSLNSAIASCAAAGQMDAAMKIYEQSFRKAKIRPTIVTTNSLVSTAHRWIKKRRSDSHHNIHTGSNSNNNNALDPSDAKRAIDFVRKVITDATKRGDELDMVSINTLVSAYGAAGDVRSALKLFQNACSQNKATTVTANAALSALAIVGKATEASDLVHALATPSTKTSSKLNIRSDLTSWNTAISACSVHGDFEKALELFEEMPYRPDAHTFVSVLASVTEGGAATYQSVHELLAQADASKATTTFVINAAIAALDRLGDPSAVQALFENGFRERGLTPDVISYNTAIHSLGKSDPIVAVEIFSRMQAPSSEDNKSAIIDPDEQSYCAVVSALASSGQHKEALAIVESCPKELQSVGMYNEVLRACQSAAEPEASLKLLRRMQSDGPAPNLVSTTIVVNTCAQEGSPEYCVAGFVLFEELAQTQVPDRIAYNSAIALAEKAGNADMAISLLTQLIRADGVSPDAVSFCSAIAACERSNTPRFRSALRLLKESIKAVGPDAACYIATVQTLCATGELDRAQELLSHDCVANFDSQSKYVLYRTVQVGCATSGDSEAADRLSKEMQNHNLKALAPLARARVDGYLREFNNKIVPSSSDISTSDVANKVQELVRKTNHEFVTSALPIEFQKSSPLKSQHISLANHAEKKALARLLLEEETKKKTDPHPSFATLAVEINFKMCADCHDFFKGASAYLDRRITVKEPTMLHVFEDGECSCNDSWRWEERHASLEKQSLLLATTANKASCVVAGKHRFGRLPPLLKP